MNVSRAFRPVARASKSFAKGQRRWKSGGIVDQNNSHLFGEVPGKHAKEGWETVWYSTCAATIAIMIFGIGQRPTTGIEQWAMDEAIARNKAEAEGVELKYGVHYSNKSLSFKKSDDGMPELVDDDDA